MENILLLDEFFITIRITGNRLYWTYNYLIENTGGVKDVFINSYMILESDLNLNQLRLLETDHLLFFTLPSSVTFFCYFLQCILHGRAIPSLNIKIDACLGHINQFLFIINREEDFYGQCSEIRGVNRGFMPVNIVGFLFNK